MNRPTKGEKAIETHDTEPPISHRDGEGPPDDLGWGEMADRAIDAIEKAGERYQEAGRVVRGVARRKGPGLLGEILEAGKIVARLGDEETRSAEVERLRDAADRKLGLAEGSIETEGEPIPKPRFAIKEMP